MFSRRSRKGDLVHIADVTQGSAHDYLAASFESQGSERAAFLVLAHTQLTAASAFWAQAMKEDKSLGPRYEGVDSLEQTLRFEVYGLVDKGLSAASDEPFPCDDTLRGTLQQVIAQHRGPDFPVALQIGAQAAWENPFSNVARRSP